MRKFAPLLFAMLLFGVVATAPVAAAATPAGSPGWAGWWSQLTVWAAQWLPIQGTAVAASSDGESPAPEDDGSAPPGDDGADAVPFGGGDHKDSGPHWDPDG